MLMDISVYDFTLTRALRKLSLSRTHALLQRSVMRDTTRIFRTLLGSALSGATRVPGGLERNRLGCSSTASETLALQSKNKTLRSENGRAGKNFEINSDSIGRNRYARLWRALFGSSKNK